jgi:AraC-like DNA-binding protein
MYASVTYPVSPAWLLLMRDLGLSSANVLRRARMPSDLLEREHASLRVDEFVRLLRALDEEAADPALAIRIGESLSFEMFDPPVFAAMCSEDFNSAVERISCYKRLCAPVGFNVEVGRDATRVVVVWTEPRVVPPPLLFAMDLTYCVRLMRLGTRTNVRPRAVTCQFPLAPAAKYEAYFGVGVDRAADSSLVFDAADAALPFLTAQAGMWSIFEPVLRRRLAELDARATVAERVRAALIELLPSGRASMSSVAEKLGAGARTLQRRLREEHTTFQRVLDTTREELARHYLGTTNMTGTEIAFLLGFEDPNSFVRAFHGWTGATPEQTRAELRAVTQPARHDPLAG